MGTLFNQQPRDNRTIKGSDLDHFLSTMVELAKKHKIAVSEVIAAHRVLEMKRSNDLYVNNGDAFDEQLAGFGKLLQELCSAIDGLKGGA